MNRVIVAGGRDFNDYELLKQKLDTYLSNLKDVEIVSGGCQGADDLGERYAIENRIDLVMFPADWIKYGKAAGPIRNKEMAEYANYLIAFWNGKSKGTANMIKLAQDNNLKIKIIRYG